MQFKTKIAAGLLAFATACGAAGVGLAQPPETRRAPAASDLTPPPPLPLPPKPGQPPALPDLLLEALRQDITREDYLAAVMQPLRQYDRDRDGIDAGDVAEEELRIAAEQRAGVVGLILRYDLDGDGRVTREELSHFDRSTQFSQRMVEMYLAQYDLDHDGVITVSEILQAKSPYPRPINPCLRALLALAPGKGGRLTAQELARLALARFDAIDVDHDTRISAAELQAVRPTRQGGLAGRIELPAPPVRVAPPPETRSDRP